MRQHRVEQDEILNVKGVLVSPELLLALVPEDGDENERSWQITEPDGLIRSFTLRREGDRVYFTEAR